MPIPRLRTLAVVVLVEGIETERNCARRTSPDILNRRPVAVTARRNHAVNTRPDSLGELLSIAGLLRLPVHRGETGASERLGPRERTRDHFRRWTRLNGGSVASPGCAVTAPRVPMDSIPQVDPQRIRRELR